jgi:MFS family permease
MLAGTGVGNTVSSVLRGTTNQMLTPDELRGRVSAVNSSFVIGGPMLGQFRGGALAELWGAQVSGALGGLGAILCAVAIGVVPGIWRFQLGSGDETPSRAATEPGARQAGVTSSE